MKYQGRITDPKDLVTKEYVDNKLAPVETSPATAAHTAGSLLLYNGTLYRATADIAIGATLTVGTNISATDLDEIASLLKSAISEKTSIDLGITGAAVGQFAKIKTVDANGKPTSWEYGAGGGGINVMDAVLWRPPVNFGKVVNGVVGDNIKVYRSWADDKLVFLGTGEMYGGTSMDDPYLISNICGKGNTTVREIYIQEGITTIGPHVFNRFSAAATAYTAFKYWADVTDKDSGSPLGFTTSTLVLPSTITTIEYRAFQYFHANQKKLVVLSDGVLQIGGDAFQGSYFWDISIPNATEIYVGNTRVFESEYLRYFSVGGTLMSNLKFTSTVLTNDSLINIANHLLNVVGTETSRTLTLESAVKTTIASLMGTVADDEFTASSSGTVSLQDFITTNRGWSIA